MKIKFLPLLGLVLLAAACETETYEQTDLGGFNYVMHVDEPGDRPQPNDHVKFHITMRAQKAGMPDTTVWSTYVQNGGKPVDYQVPDFQDARAGKPFPEIATLLMMSAGDSATTMYRIDTAEQKPRGFEEYEQLMYDLKLLEVMTDEEYQRIEGERLKKAEARSATVKDELDGILETYRAGGLDDQLVDLGDGLKKYVIEAGDGATPTQGQTVVAQYYGTLTDGTRFDDSYSRGAPFTFPLGQQRVIGGWDRGFAQMQVGEKAVLFIPSALGYGAAGSPPRIPGDSDLAFLVELEGIQ